jgi:hypothetical protein
MFSWITLTSSWIGREPRNMLLYTIIHISVEWYRCVLKRCEFPRRGVIGDLRQGPRGEIMERSAQPYGSRIRHEYEKNPSAILMRILQSRR